ncbi:MAG TPA: poly-gamma-glutamate biosynthesis protein PgsC [Terrisporobacter glycolicus]|uniref:Poly-gamma-glutamate biosynthesis protein PgsC n=2 Tax=Terrisporobacter TaxID=1505652 RepID=A0AAX2ZCX5_9FIRM|nr:MULTISPECIES: poly-gamma-glutamate biosynthesis protein PgsC [Terrisporobacter]MBN9646788.1 poly-gamma-glutamate biosynthesis protein PgsC [Terrisporobacter glycolicus]UEL46570.1 poly-gamma-glutamate biosynthesis protein PgsC [Terrisporobacter hibernicus]UPA29799.1 poly-gamma-glutamate biosynthesis protein PgsC [Terrisporobacter glycolicus]SFI96868.1 poly-gamma-glutamate biosynthesis protein PgsC/CapC [Terrisporobacter glycolicus]HBI91596.1 poly-gamma-glutamate biosynthesis protein PgsC [Te
MFITDFYMALIIGVASTLLFTEKTGITPGGLIAASYLALVFDSPITLALIFLVSFITYWLVNFVLPKFVILYGKRKFTATLIIAIVLKLVFEFAYPLTPFPTFEFRGIGVIVPALLANSYSRQGIKLTVISTLLMTGFVFALMQILYLV